MFLLSWLFFFDMPILGASNFLSVSVRSVGSGRMNSLSSITYPGSFGSIKSDTITM